MFGLMRDWGRRYFADSQAAVLLLFIIGALLAVIFLGEIFAPLLAGLVLAYLLEALIQPLQRYLRFPRWLALSTVYLGFIGALVLIIVWLLPAVSRQLAQLLSDLPAILQAFHQYLYTLPTHYPTIISQQTMDNLISNTNIDPNRIASVGQTLFSVSLASLPAIVTALVYILLVPLLALFFLKDKVQLIAWCQHIFPRDRGLLVCVWRDMRAQLGNYVRGKVLEVFIVGVATYIGFIVFGLQYAILLAVLVGLSVIIPYVGMVVVTVPVVAVGLIQFGASSTFVWMFLVYLVIQFLDGNVLVPILFSEVVNLHPVAIIAAVLFFGGIWGFWGLFFAIPLATLVKSLMTAWADHAKIIQPEKAKR